jgi:hypothetical protein
MVSNEVARKRTNMEETERVSGNAMRSEVESHEEEEEEAALHANYRRLRSQYPGTEILVCMIES